MKRAAVILLAIAVGWLLGRRKPTEPDSMAELQAYRDKYIKAPARPASYTWTSADGAVTLAWPDNWLVGGEWVGVDWGKD